MVAMRGVELFRAGRWRGRDFTEDHLDQMVSNFERFQAPNASQRLHRVALVKGHRREDLHDPSVPKHGTLCRLYREGPVLKCDVERVDPEFAKEVEDGRFEDISIEAYDTPPEGVPGTGRMVRRVAILGGDVPYIKNLNSRNGLAATLEYGEEDDGRPRIAIMRTSNRRGVCGVFSERVLANEAIDRPVSRDEAELAAFTTFAESRADRLAVLEMEPGEVVQAWRSANAADRTDLERMFGFFSEDARPVIDNEVDFATFAETKEALLSAAGVSQMELFRAWQGADYRDRKELERWLGAVGDAGAIY